MTPPPKRDWDTYSHPAMTYKAPKGLLRFQAGLTLVVSTLLVVGLWVLVWFGAEFWARSTLTDWIAAERAQGVTLGYETMVTTGFPSRIILTLAKPSYAGRLLGQDVKWHGESLVVQARPWMPWRLHMEAPGKQTLTLGDGTSTLTGQAQALTADLVIGDIWPKILDLNLSGLEMSNGEPVSVDDFQAHFNYDPDGKGLIVALKGKNLVLPRTANLLLGNHVQDIDMAVRVTGPLTPGALIEGLPQWRDSGGDIEVERFKIRTGPLGVAASGTVTLDKTLQPMGAFTAKIEGLFQVLEILRVRGLVSASDAVIATMALSALSKRSKNGGAASINLAVTVQNGQLSLGNIKVMAMPHFGWGIKPKPTPVAKAVPLRDYKDVPPIF